MIKPIPGLERLTEPLKPYARRPEHSLKFLQQHDAFFSAYSFRAQRAQLSQFVTQRPQHPLVFAFTPAEQRSLWDKLVPANQRHIIVIRPKFEAPDPTQPTNTTAAPVDLEVPSAAASQPEPKIEGAEYPAQPSAEPGSEPSALPPVPSHVHIQELEGHLLPAQHYSSLQNAFAQNQSPADQPAWIQETRPGSPIVMHQHPMKTGLSRITHPILGTMARWAAKLLGPLLGVKVQADTLQFPNGARRPLLPERWEDASGNRSKVYQAMQLPDGRWLAVHNVIGNHKVAFTDTQSIFKTVTDSLKRVEQQGYVREVLPAATTAAQVPVPAFPAQAKATPSAQAESPRLMTMA